MKQTNHSDIAEQKFRPLKKSLQIPYKKIKNDLEDGRLPDSTVIAEFITLSQIMISYPGFGDEYYQEYSKACLALEKACRSKDLSAAQESFSLIRQLKHDCHHRR